MGASDLDRRFDDSLRAMLELQRLIPLALHTAAARQSDRQPLRFPGPRTRPNP